VATLGLVSPGAVTNGVTYFYLKRWWWPSFLPCCMQCRRGLAIRGRPRLSVCPSVCQTRELWQNGRNTCPDFYTTQKIIYPSFLRRRMAGGATLSTWNFGSTGLRWSEIADFQPIFAFSDSAVTPSEKSPINTNRRKSTMRFPMSLRWSSYVASKLKKAKRPISV